LIPLTADTVVSFLKGSLAEGEPRGWLVASADDPAFDLPWSHRRRLKVVREWIEPPGVAPLPRVHGFSVRATVFSADKLAKGVYTVTASGAIEAPDEPEIFDLNEVRRLGRNHAFECHEQGRIAEAEATLGPMIEIMEAMRLDGIPESVLWLRSSYILLGHCLRARGDQAGMVACFVRKVRSWRGDPDGKTSAWAPTLFATQPDRMNASLFGTEAVTPMPPDWLPPDLAGVRVNRIDLPFYPGAVLWQAFFEDGVAPEWILDGGGDLWSLHIDEDLIQEANAKIPLCLTAATVVPYLKFWALFSWFYQGPSYMIDGPDHPAWSLVTDPVDPEALARLGPPCLLESPQPGTFVVESSVIECCLRISKGISAHLETYVQAVTLDGTVDDWRVTEDEDDPAENP